MRGAQAAPAAERKQEVNRDLGGDLGWLRTPRDALSTETTEGPLGREAGAGPEGFGRTKEGGPVGATVGQEQWQETGSWVCWGSHVAGVGGERRGVAGVGGERRKPSAAG